VAEPRTDDIVNLTLEGTGRVWPAGRHHRSGRILKGGITEDCALVRLFRPVPERVDGRCHPCDVVNVPVSELRRVGP
jgi:hypothetical protein